MPKKHSEKLNTNFNNAPPTFHGAVRVFLTTHFGRWSLTVFIVLILLIVLSSVFFALMPIAISIPTIAVTGVTFIVTVVFGIRSLERLHQALLSEFYTKNVENSGDVSKRLANDKAMITKYSVGNNKKYPFVMLLLVATLGLNTTDVVLSLINLNAPPKYSTCEYGRYPQSKVTDQSLINSLNTLSGDLPTKDDKKNWTSYKYYISESKDTDFMWYIDIDNDNDGIYDYRGVYFTDYRPYYTSFISRKDYSCQFENGYETGNRYWFKYEPITWRILSISDNDKHLMSNVILDSQEYFHLAESDVKRSRTDYQGHAASEVYDNNYQYSNLRNFLNVSFYNSAFSDEEKSNIKVTTVNNKAETTYSDPNPYACDDTEDKIYALSYSEANALALNDRLYKATDYAKAQGIYCNNLSSNGCSYWWLRSPFISYSYSVSHIYSDGHLYLDHNVRYTSDGVVPVMHISL